VIIGDGFGEGAIMTHHEHPNVTLVREGFEAFARGDMEWMDAHLSDDIVWHVGGNSKWSGAYEGKATVLDFFGRQAQAMGSAPSAEVHDVLGNDEHVVVLGTASATGPDGSSAGWKYVQIFHIKDGKATEVWGMAENDADVDPFLDALPS
jgi:ketosteroid isomerase-like protein